MPISAKEKARARREKNPKPKQRYKIKNWQSYNTSLRQRGSLTVWISNEAIRAWKAKPSGKQGRPATYSDLAIETALTIGKVFNQPLRQTQGLVASIIRMLKAKIHIPDFSTLSRRSESLNIRLPKKAKQSVIMLVDSTGLKVYGEGEWKVKKHGVSKHRTWQKFHLAIDRDNEIRAAKLSPSHTIDAEMLPALVDQETERIDVLIADGSYDQKSVYDKCQKKNIKKVIIPPRKDANLWQRNQDRAPPMRDFHVKRIWKTSREQWKRETGYHLRSLVETAMFRIRKTFGGTLRAKTMNTQTTEAMIMCAAMNRMTHLGMPDSVKIL